MATRKPKHSECAGCLYAGEWVDNDNRYCKTLDYEVDAFCETPCDDRKCHPLLLPQEEPHYELPCDDAAPAAVAPKVHST